MTEPQAYTIKPLVWKREESTLQGSMIAVTSFGTYEIVRYGENPKHKRFECSLHTAHISFASNLHDAVSICERDYADRMKRNLTPLPPAEPDVVRTVTRMEPLPLQRFGGFVFEKTCPDNIPLPPAGREIARWESEIRVVEEKWSHGGNDFRRISCCRCPQYQYNDDGPWCDFGFLDDGHPGPDCPRHAAPGTTPVEVVVREREVG